MAKKEQTYGEAMQAASLIKFCKEKLQKTNIEIQKILDKIE